MAEDRRQVDDILIMSTVLYKTERLFVDVDRELLQLVLPMLLLPRFYTGNLSGCVSQCVKMTSFTEPGPPTPDRQDSR